MAGGSGLVCNIWIVDYKLIEEYSAAALNTEVCKYLANGWTPYGNPYVLHCGGGSTILHHYQAMVKVKK